MRRSLRSSVWRRAGLLSALCLSFAVACGRSVHHGDDDDTAGGSGAPQTGGSSGNGGSGAASGASSQAGAPANGGSTNGGSANGGSANGGSANGGSGNEGGIPDLPPLRRVGHFIEDPDGKIIDLRGISFGNDVWNEPSVPLTTHHTEADFARLNDWGANAVRFYLNYQLFEDDSAPGVYKTAGFDYLDRNIAWAQQHGVYLIFNMHVPQGGFQSNGDGGALWAEPSNQDRLVALWRAIAQHCKDVAAVAGFDLLNEPRPTTSKSEWVSLAGRITSAIREVDPDHLLVVERTNSVGDDWSNDADMNFFLVPDDNVLYEFHFYEPFEYTTQWAEWLDLGEGGKYPDSSLVSSANLSWYDWNYEPKPPPYAPPGDSDWQLYTSDFYTIT
ncbi:MAG TPA: cellulase family glycosylhydrolase, partial [Polyangiaceae bacterium]|nr:cellulase family glycosylhydrolase [Polyangiaceae bacterium]